MTSRSEGTAYARGKIRSVVKLDKAETHVPVGRLRERPADGQVRQSDHLRAQ
jgi:hypothetical protein